MITPLFRLTQDEQYLYVTLVAPNMRLAEAELYHEGEQFVFHASPYYLRLELPGQVKTSERIQEAETTLEELEVAAKKKPTIHFDAEKGELVVPVEKAVAGQHFTGLEALGRLLSGPKSRLSRRLIEVLQEDGGKTPLIEDLTQGDDENQEEEEEDFDWNIEQTLPEEESGALSSLLGQQPYGFALRYSGVLERLGAELAAELVDIREPGRKSRAERRAERLAAEEADFDEDHYVADLYDDDEDGGGGGSRIEEIIAAEAPWEQDWQSSISADGSPLLSNEDRLRLIEHIPRGKGAFLAAFDQATTKVLLLGLADLLFAYAYDCRTTDWEHSSESAWTIRKLSPTLSWFEYYASAQGDKVESRRTVLAGCIRRSLVYPLYCSWTLALKVAHDVVAILAAGQAAVLKCLIDMHRLFSEGEHCYLLNDLYIADYIGWLQQLKGGGEKMLRRFSQDLNEVLIGGGQGRGLTKDDVHLELELIERAAAEMLAMEAAIKADRSADKATVAGAEGLCQRLERSMRLAAEGDDELDSDDDEEPTVPFQQ